MKNQKLILMFLFLGAFLFFGCLGTENGINNNTTIPGADKDEHGCIGSAGYTWCEPLQKCIRSWEENCTANTQNINQEAIQHCSDENVAAVYVCGPYIRTVSSLLGGGSTFYENGVVIATCPVVGPDSISEECNLLLNGNNCIEEEINCSDKCFLKGENKVLSLEDAISIAKESECSEYELKPETSTCNFITGTWWIDLSIQKTGCSPACVIDVSNEKAEINWRCTGELPQ